MHLLVPWLLVGVLAGLGVYGVIARRNAVMVLVGAELLLNAAVLLLVTADVAPVGAADPLLSGQVGALFAVTVAAAEIGLALAIVLLLFRTRGTADLRSARSLGETARRGTRRGSPVSPTDVVLVLVLAPVLAAVVGLPLGRIDRRLAVGCGVGGTLVSLLASLWLARETWDGYPFVTGVPFLGRVDTGIGAGHLGARPARRRSRRPGGGGRHARRARRAGLLRRVPRAARRDDADPAPTRYPAYAATVSLFTAAMLLVVQADDLFLVLVGWEVMGLCSYLLVGHHSERPAARRAAVQAFLVTRVGDVAFVLGIVVLYAATGTSRIGGVIARVDEMGTATATLAALLLIVGVMGKSAQFPLHGWLPDAMEGPTPVSALIHAATMVAAGVVVLARLQALLEAAPIALAALAVVTTMTMVGAAVAALVADDIKRVLAWSTISQVAIMLGALSLGSDAGRASAMAHLLSHAAFKSLLFLAAGVLAHHAGTTLLTASTRWAVVRRGRPRPGRRAALARRPAAVRRVPVQGGRADRGRARRARRRRRRPSWVGATLLVGVGLTSVLTGAYADGCSSVTVRRPRAAEPVWDEEWEEAWRTGSLRAADGEDDYDLVFRIDPEYHPEDYVAPSPAERERRCTRRGAGPARGARREAERREAGGCAAARAEAEDQERPRGRRLAAPARRPAMGLIVGRARASSPSRVAALPLAGCAAAGPVDLELVTAAVGGLLAVTGLIIGISRGTARHDRPGRPRAGPAAGGGAVGYGYQPAQQALVVRPVQALRGWSAPATATSSTATCRRRPSARAGSVRRCDGCRRRRQGYLSWWPAPPSCSVSSPSWSEAARDRRRAASCSGAGRAAARRSGASRPAAAGRPATVALVSAVLGAAVARAARRGAAVGAGRRRPVDVAWADLLRQRLWLGWDGITAPLVVLTAVLVLLCVLYLRWTDDGHEPADEPGAGPGRTGPGACSPACCSFGAGAVATFLARDLLRLLRRLRGRPGPDVVRGGRFGDARRPERDGEAARSAAATRFVSAPPPGRR